MVNSASSARATSSAQAAAAASWRLPIERFGSSGKTIGLNIGLPTSSDRILRDSELSSSFTTFHAQLWFAHMAGRSCLPRRFGTLDELTEILTLAQTGKLDRSIVILLYGSSYWKEILNFELSCATA